MKEEDRAREVLADCPFCGGNEAFVERADLSSCYVICNDCSARGPTSCDEDNEDAMASEADEVEPGERPARRLWNTRAFATPSPVIETEGSGDDEGPCTDCYDTGITIQTERRCACQPPLPAERSTDREALLSRELIGEAAEAGYRQGYGDGVEDATPEGERPYVDGVGQSEGWMQWRDDVLPTLFPSKRSAVELAATSGQDDVIAVLAPAAILALRPVGAENVREPKS